jgi:hypothetical protein
VLGRVAFGVGLGIAGFSLSLTLSVTSVSSLTVPSDGWLLSTSVALGSKALLPAYEKLSELLDEQLRLQPHRETAALP